MRKTNTQKEIKMGITLEEDLILSSFLRTVDKDVVILHILGKIYYDGQESKYLKNLTKDEFNDLPNYWIIMILVYNPEFTDQFESYDRFNKDEKNIILKYRPELKNKF
jgi:hypothetical protein